jgi:hypothetical protein
LLRCVGWHCNRCGAPTPSNGHRNECPDRPPATRNQVAP